MAIKFLNTVAVDTDVLYVDASSNNVGIGTTSPNAKLDIQGTQGQLFSVTDDLSGSIFAVSDISGVPIFDVNSSGVSYFDGNVGIGTTSPQAKLQINNGNLYFKNDSYGDNNRIGFGNPARNGDAGYIDYIGHGNFTGHIAFGLVTTSSNVAASEVARFNNQGNFGIGTTSPGAKLDVAGDIRLNSIGQELQFSNHSVGAYRDGSNRLMISGYGGIRFQAEAVGGMENQATRMVINPSGNVGIGTTSPSHLLTLETASSPGLKIKDTTQGATLLAFSQDSNSHIGTYSSHPLVFDTNSTERMRITSAGNVGIGTTSPGTKLHVGSGSGATVDTGYQMVIDSAGIAGLQILSATTQSGRIVFGDSGDNDIGMIKYDHTDNSMGFRTNGSGNERMRIASDGKIGIGTTSPNHKLDIYSNENVPLRIHRPSNANLDSSGAWGIGFSTRGDANNSTTDTRAGIFSYYNGNLFLAANNTSIVSDPDAYARLTVLSAGNVGIGTTSPNALLDVDGGKIRLSSSGTRQLEIGTDATISFGSNDNIQIRKTSNDLQFKTGASERMRITSLGNVGIGTTSPSERLQVYEGGLTAYKSYTATNAGAILTAYQSTFSPFTKTTDLVAGSDSTVPSEIRFLTRTSGTSTIDERMRITSAGNVGIGTTSPTYKLQVEGNAYVDSTLSVANTSTSNSYIYLLSSSTGESELRMGDSDTDAGSIAYNNAFDFMAFRANAAERMRIASGGNVGIGTTNPSEKLEVAGNARITGDVTLSNGNALRWTSDDVRIEGTTAGDNIKFYVANTEILQLAQSGTLATVTGNLRVTGAYYDSNNLPGTSGQVLSSTATGTDWVSLSEISGVDGTGTTNYVAKWSDSDTITDSVIYDDGTNVGIGTTSPGHKLTVEGNIELGTGGYIYGDTNSPSVRLNSLQGSYLQYGTSSWVSVGYNVVTFRTSSSERMRIDSSGNVGIGTTSPSEKLHIYNGTAYVTPISYASNQDAYALKVGAYNNAAFDMGLKIKSTAGGSPYMSFETSTASDVLVMQGANVGIGTTNPDVKLHLSGISQTGSESVFKIENDTSNTKFQIRSISGDYNLQFKNAGNVTRVFLNSNGDSYLNGGNVGIGTTSPIGRLNVVNGTSGQTYSNVSGVLIDVNGSSNSYYGLRVGSSTGNDHFCVTNAGNVGIGTASPSQALEVNGNIQATGTRSISSLFDANHYMRLESNSSGGILKGTDGGVTTTLVRTYGDSYFNGGNFGIGTTSPNYLLDVEGSVNNADIAIRINNTFDDNLATSNPASVLWLNAASNNGYLRVHGAPADTAAKHQIDLGSTAGSSFLTFSPGGAERMRITTLGGISFGSTGTAYGTSGQVLTSSGDATPTWTTPTTGTVTGTGAVNQVAFWDGTSSLSGNQNLYWDSTNNHLGIGDATPGSKLKVTSGVDETSIYTVDVNHVRNDADVATIAMRLNVDLSGADTTTADRTNYGLFVDADSSANGDASNEHRIYGVGSFVNFTGFTDLARGGYFLAESNYTGGKTAQLVGVYGNATHDTSSTDGGVSNMYGAYGTSSIQDLGDVDYAFGGYFSVTISTNRGNADIGVTKGVEGEIQIDKADTIAYGEMMAVSGIIDNNEGTVPTFQNQYLFKGDYQGTKGGNAYGIYTEGDKHYFDGNIGIGTTSATSRLTVQENGITTKIATVTIGDTTAGASLTLRGGSPTIYFDRTGTDPQNKILMDSAGLEFKSGTLDAEGDVDFKITAGGDLQLSKGAKISNQENTDVDTGAETVAEVSMADYTAAFFDFVIKKGTNVRSGTVYACHDGGSTPVIEFTEISTQDLGDTSDVVLSVDKTGSGGGSKMRLLATTTSDDWSVKTLIRAI